MDLYLMLDASFDSFRPIQIGEIAQDDWNNILRSKRVYLAKMDDINPTLMLILPQDYHLSNTIILMRIGWGIR